MRRMFNAAIFERENFYELTDKQKWLYVSLCMSCDSDGISTTAKREMKFNDATQEDLETLINNGLVIKDNESAAICIVHWHIHNQLRGDIYKETQEKRFKSKIYVTEYLELTLDETPFNYAEIYTRGGSLANKIKDTIEMQKPSETKIGACGIEGEETAEDRLAKERLLDQANMMS